MNQMPKFNPFYLLDKTELDIASLIQLAEKAGKKIMEIYKQDFTINYKEDHSPVTSADLASNDIICASLKEWTPQIPIISEELEKPSFNNRQNEPYIWLVDPLDGTKEFVKKTGEFTVNIGLAENGCAVLGIVNIPAKEITYFASKHNGAYKLDHKSGKISPLKAATFKEKDSNLRLVASTSHPSTETDTFIKQFKSPQLLSFGSSLKLLMTAEGSADIYPRFGLTWEWDTCAADIILKEAGGSCVNAETKMELIYNKKDFRNPFFICYGNCLKDL